MPKLALAFFATAAIFALTGMVWGIEMGIREDLVQAPAHAHLNLVGWTTLALMGSFYALAGDRVTKWLGWVNYGLSTCGVIVMIPSLAVLLSSGGQANPGLIAGSLLTIAGMAAFLTSVLSLWRKANPA